MEFDPSQPAGPLVASLAVGNPDPRDAAAYLLAYRLAQRLDRAHSEDDIKTFGELAPKLLAALDALGATPKSRAALKTGVKQDEPVSALAKLRSARLQAVPSLLGDQAAR